MLCHAEDDRLEVRRQTNEQDKHLDVISDALSDLQRIGEVTHLCTMNMAILYVVSSVCLAIHPILSSAVCACLCLFSYRHILTACQALFCSLMQQGRCFQPCELTGFCCL